MLVVWADMRGHSNSAAKSQTSLHVTSNTSTHSYIEQLITGLPPACLPHFTSMLASKITTVIVCKV